MNFTLIYTLLKTGSQAAIAMYHQQTPNTDGGLSHSLCSHDAGFIGSSRELCESDEATRGVSDRWASGGSESP